MLKKAAALILSAAIGGLAAVGSCQGEPRPEFSPSFRARCGWFAGQVPRWRPIRRRQIG